MDGGAFFRFMSTDDEDTPGAFDPPVAAVAGAPVVADGAVAAAAAPTAAPVVVPPVVPVSVPCPVLDSPSRDSFTDVAS